MAAVVAERLAPALVQGEAHRAVGARRLLAALAAQQAGGPAPAVQEEQGLLVPLEAQGEGFLEGGAQDGVASGLEHGPAVDDLDLRETPGRDAQRKAQQCVLAALGVVVRLEGRCRGAEDDGGSFETGAHDRHVATVVARAVFLLVGSLVLFVDDDEAERRQGREHRRAGAHDHLRLGVADAPPLVVPFPRRQLAVLYGYRRAEAGEGGAHEHVGERDLGHEDQHGPARFEGPFGGAEVDLGLAAARDAVEEEWPEAFLGHGRLEGRYHHPLIGGGLWPLAVSAGERVGPAHVALVHEPQRSALGEATHRGP